MDLSARRASQGLAAVLALAILGSPASAQVGEDLLDSPKVFKERLETPEVGEPGEAPPVELWSYDPLYDSGWRARALIGTMVRGAGGAIIGDVEDLIVRTEGPLVGIVVETGGFLDIGDTHLLVPWPAVTVDEEETIVSVPVSQGNVDDFDLIDADEPVEEAIARLGGWHAAWLLGNGVDALGIGHYGTIVDLIFGREGGLTAVVVDPDDAVDEGGPYAFPYLDDAYDPVFNAYTVPYTPEESAELPPFDFGAMEDDLFE